MFELWAFNKKIANAKYWEDLVDFVEELKILNHYTVDRKNYQVKCNGEVIYYWSRS